MKYYWIIKENGTALFELPYPEDFIYHCLIKLLDSSSEQYKLLPFPYQQVTDLLPSSFFILGHRGSPKL
jgi:hypothetical protein